MTTKRKKSKSKGSKKIGAMGTKIMAEAKRIRKAHPGKKWTSCVREGAKKLKK